MNNYRKLKDKGLTAIKTLEDENAFEVTVTVFDEAGDTSEKSEAFHILALKDRKVGLEKQLSILQEEIADNDALIADGEFVEPKPKK